MTTLAPADIHELTQRLAASDEQGEKISALDLAALNRVLEFTPEDMTVTVEAGLTLARLQDQLAERGQWLPVDPPHPEQLSVGSLLAANRSGPRRFGCGTIRDYLIGIQAALADGRLIKAGGKVVKNVAGFDLGKLFVGSRGSLGVIVQATFQLRPLPETERLVQARVATPDQAMERIDAVLNSELVPVVLDLHNLAADKLDPAHDYTIVLGVAGTQKSVEWQLDLAGQLGFQEPSDLQYETRFWTDALKPPHHLSVLPSRLGEILKQWEDQAVVARAGNGVIYYRGNKVPDVKNTLPRFLLERIKEAYDPNHILPELPW